MSQVVWLLLCISIEMVVVDLYSIGTQSSNRGRERERRKVSRRVGSWVSRQDDERKGENRKRKIMSVSVVVVVVVMWALVHLPLFFFSPTLWCKFRQTERVGLGTGKLIHLFVVISFQFAHIICYPPPHMHSLSS